MNPEQFGNEPKKLDETVEHLKERIDVGAEELKSRVSGTVYQLGDFIDSADRVIDKTVDRFDDVARQVVRILNSAERIMDNLDRPITTMRKHPVAVVSGVLLFGVALGLLVRRDAQRSSFEQVDRLQQDEFTASNAASVI